MKIMLNALERFDKSRLKKVIKLDMGEIVIKAWGTNVQI